MLLPSLLLLRPMRLPLMPLMLVWRQRPLLWLLPEERVQSRLLS